MDLNKCLFASWLEELAVLYGDRPALTCGMTLSYQQLWDAASRCALALHDTGVRKGDKVILWAVIGVDWLVAFYGITLAGGVASLVNYSLSASEVVKLTKMVGASWAVIGENRVSGGLIAAMRASSEGGVSEGHVLSLTDVFQQSMDASLPVDIEALHAVSGLVQPRDTQCIIYTTGSTALPKAVQLSSYGIPNNAEASHLAFGKNPTESTCIALPLFHVYGLVVTLAKMTSGLHVYLARNFKAAAVKELIVNNNISTLDSVPAIFSGLVMLPDFEELIGILKVCVVGGGFANPAGIIRIESLLEGSKVLPGYGQTECSGVISITNRTDPLERRASTVGWIAPHFDARIWLNGKGFLKPGEVGELVVKGPCIMNGYLGIPEDEQPIDGDGWLHTGDLATLTEDGLLTLRGRMKDIICHKGENISPLDVEKAILKVSYIRDAKVFGAPHPAWGESVEACVVYSDDAPDEDVLRAASQGIWRASRFPPTSSSIPNSRRTPTARWIPAG